MKESAIEIAGFEVFEADKKVGVPVVAPERPLFFFELIHLEQRYDGRVDTLPWVVLNQRRQAQLGCRRYFIMWGT